MLILYITTISSTLSFFVDQIKLLQSTGNTVELATNTENPMPQQVAALGCTVHHIPFSRSPLNKANLTAYKQFRKLVSERRYDVLHTHTPNASAIVRLAAGKARRNGTKVFYTAHGFHFYTGAPLKNWLLFYPVEWLCSFRTDVQITINQEDYNRAKKHFHAKKIVYTHGGGGGVGLRSFVPASLTAEERAEEREKLGVAKDDVLLINAGELSHRKNQKAIIEAMSLVKNPHVKLIICGDGPLEAQYAELINKLGLSEKVKLLGYRNDLSRLYVCTDVFAFPSYQEGLSAALLEIMACGLPAVCSSIRGNTDLIENGVGGFLHKPDDVAAIADGIERLAADPELRRKMGERNREFVKNFGPDVLLPEIAEIYGVPYCK